MNNPTRRTLVQDGEVAPKFSLPAVSQEGTIALDDFQGKNALLLGMLRGVYCPFCRRQMVKLNDVAAEIRPLGIDTLLVVTTEGNRARVYFEHYPTTMLIVSDPEMVTHRAYGVTRPDLTESPTKWPETVNPNDLGVVHTDHSWPDVTEPTSLLNAVDLLDAKDGYQRTDAEQREQEMTWHQLSGLVLIDKTGIVRWTDIEAPGGLTDFGNIASAAEIVAATQRIAG